MQAMEEHGRVHWYSHSKLDSRDAARAMRVMMNSQCSQLFVEVCASHATQGSRVLHMEYHGNMQEGNMDGEEQILRLLDQCTALSKVWHARPINRV